VEDLRVAAAGGVLGLAGRDQVRADVSGRDVVTGEVRDLPDQHRPGGVGDQLPVQVGADTLAAFLDPDTSLR
jgi:hypothetical protein